MVYISAVGQDYANITSLFEFQPLATRSCITINTIEDSSEENTEQFSVSISLRTSDVAVLVGQPSRAIITILDNDTPPPSSKHMERGTPLIRLPERVTSIAQQTLYSSNYVWPLNLDTLLILQLTSNVLYLHLR